MNKTIVNTNKMTRRQAFNAMVEMIRHNIRSQYRNSILGVIWTVLHPLLNMIVLAVVFTHLLSNRGISTYYPVYIMSGTVLFNFLRMSTTSGMTCIVRQRDLLHKTRIPHLIFPTSVLLTSTITFWFSLIAQLMIMIFALIIHKPVVFSWTMLMIFIFFPSLMLFAYGMQLILCTLYVKFRDVSNLYSVFLTLWTYATPLFYSETILSEKIRFVMKFNPMYHYISYFRAIFTAGDITNWATLGICYAVGIVFAAVGLLIFKHRSKTFMLDL